jgi:hypothetical protein
MTSKPLDDVWASRDFPVLVEVARRIDQGDSLPTIDDIATALDMAPDDVALAGAALLRRNLVKAIGAAEIPVVRFMDVSAEAYFLTGLHPSGDDAITSLVSALRQAADQVDDPDEKTRLRRLADGFLGISKTVAGGVLTTFINQQING